MISFAVRNTENVLLNLRSTELRIRDRLRDTITRLTIELTRHVKEDKLSGQVLKNRTGTLRRKINYRVTETPQSIVGQVGVKLSYAAAHEYGFQGTVTVRAHLRTVTQAFGRPIAPTETAVRAHSMRMHLPERSYLRSALRDQAPTIIEQLRAAVAEASR